jgi:hypothetical protein
VATHKEISYVKSGFRIAGLLAFMAGLAFTYSDAWFFVFAVLMLVAELLGIVEEKDET